MADPVPTHRSAHVARSRAAYERSPVRKADRAFYNSPRWRRLRALKLKTSPLCERCKANGFVTRAAQVHHMVERKARPDLALDIANLQSVCLPCHNAARGGGGAKV